MLLLAAEQSPSVYQSVGYRMPLKTVEPGTFKTIDYNLTNSTPTYGQRSRASSSPPLPEDKPKSGTIEIIGARVQRWHGTDYVGRGFRRWRQVLAPGYC